MKVHELKTWPAFLEDVIEGKKTFEIRKNDRGFEAGDRLWLRGWDPRREQYNGREATVVVSHVLEAESFGMKPGYCVMSIRPYSVDGHSDEVSHLRRALKQIADYEAGRGHAVNSTYSWAVASKALEWRQASPSESNGESK